MKKYFVNILKFIVLTIVVYIFGIVVWGVIPYSYLGSNFLYSQGSYGHLNTRIKEIPAYGEVDILFVGSSRVYRGFDPRVFERDEVKIYVLGSSSQTPLQSYVLLKRYLDDLNPKLVVFDLLPSSFAIKGVEPALDLLANDRIDQLSFEMALEQNDLMVWNTLLYASIMQLFGVHDDFEERAYKPEEGDTYIFGGYVHKKLRFNSEVECGQNSLQWRDPLPLQLKYFEKAKSLCLESGAELLFINMPLAHYDCFTNNDKLDEYRGVESKFIDFNEELDITDSFFYYDDFHLNEKGVFKLNNFLIDEFKAKF